MKNYKTFSGGLLFKADKQQTDALPIETLPAPPLVIIPLLQHAGGAPARPIVKRGDYVSMGQMIGEAVSDASAAVHASVSGTVTDLSRYRYSENQATFAVSIENSGEDEFASPIPYDKSWQDSTPDELIEKISLSGIIDFNGRAVPAHSKLVAAKNSPVDSLILNAMVTEPFANADYRYLIEQMEKVLTGGLIVKKIVGAATLSIAINEKNSILEQALITFFADERFKNIAIKSLKPKYPQHDETLLKQVCSGTPASIERSIVMNTTAAACIRDAVMESRPWYERVVTVAGEAAASPKNLLVRIGTPAEPLLKAAEVDLTKTTKIVSGGLLSGKTFPAIDAPVTKSTYALVALGTSLLRSKTFACINCGRCISVCPMRLAPARLAQLSGKNEAAETEAWFIHECIECGCCSYICPSGISLVHQIQYGKQKIDTAMRSKATA